MKPAFSIIYASKKPCLAKKSRTKDAKAYYRETFLSHSDAIAESTIDLQRMTRLERKRAKYLDRIAKGLHCRE